MTSIRPYHAAVLVLLAGALTVQPAEACPSCGMSSAGSAASSAGAGAAAGASSTVARAGSSAASSAASSAVNSAAGNGRGGGRRTPPAAGAADPVLGALGAGGPSAELAAQQAAVDKAFEAYQDANHKQYLPYTNANPVFDNALTAQLKAQARLADVKSQYEEMRKKYLDDPTAANDAQVKAAEQAIFAAEKQLSVTTEKLADVRNRISLSMTNWSRLPSKNGRSFRTSRQSLTRLRSSWPRRRSAQMSPSTTSWPIC